VPDRGVAVVTGTTHGIGQVTGRELAKSGYTVVMLCRDRAAAEREREAIMAETPQAAVHAVRCDLSSLASVREGAREVLRRFDRIALLINNAGIVSTRHRMSVDGFELTFATNHLGPFLLTRLLLERLTGHGRIVTVSSRSHYQGKLNLAQVTNPRARYGARAAYAQSKLANVLHTFALARRLATTGITVNCLHPGVVATNLLPGWLQHIKPLISRTFDAERGARTTLYLALSNEVAGVSGRYFDENQVVKAAAGVASDVTLQEELWQASERWVAAAAVAPSGFAPPGSTPPESRLPAGRGQ
jgi:NAD(P)-dependent dehydrogenase (short-subunit alcohol dehydrogenase family)